MIINPKEEGGFDNFARFVEKRAYSHNKYKLVFEDKSVVNCIFDTCSESDNCLDLDDPAYEEYWMIVFKNLATGELFEVNYHNMPVEVWCDGEKVDFAKS